jgi:hypothetical protein
MLDRKKDMKKVKKKTKDNGRRIKVRRQGKQRLGGGGGSGVYGTVQYSVLKIIIS